MKLRDFQSRMNDARKFLIKNVYLTGNCTALAEAFITRPSFYRCPYTIEAKYVDNDVHPDETLLSIPQMFNKLFKPVNLYEYDNSPIIIHFSDRCGHGWLGDNIEVNLETRLLYLDAFEGYVLSHNLYEYMIPDPDKNPVKPASPEILEKIRILNAKERIQTTYR